MVDIGVYPNQEGSEKILNFMSSAQDGFGSLEEAADHISKFLPHRNKPKDLSGLNKNLRKKDDNRFYWHWDPKFLAGRKEKNNKEYFKPLEEAAINIKQPTLLIRGALSDVLTDEETNFFLEKVKHAEFEEIENAAHMVAGDKNDIFQEAVYNFLKKYN
jgi:pimeloyl-ACP methyl ester carboxylesterase